MSELGKFEVEQEARHQAGASRRSTAYGEVINRYLGSFSYTDPYTAVPAAGPAEPATVPGTVVVGVDDTAGDHVAVDHAAIEAGLRGHALLIAHAGTPPRDSQLLRRLTRRVRERAPELAVTTRITVGMGASEVLLSAAAGTDLIVVGHRHGPLAGVLRHSVADRVADRHPGPVLVVGVSDAVAGPEPAGRPLIVGIDGSGTSAEATSFALCEARIRGCTVVLLHVTDEPAGVPDRSERIGGVAVLRRTVVGDPAAELVEASTRAAALVIGRAAGRHRLGPVGRFVLHHGHCPVFLAG
ncbi:universal stress protein [Actinoplanes sp. NPDC023714]|uniref:universal stress protein n=1 Tax=Actinoplanes sp. NPDC023714 TaxID=3154322 RepID=UPI0033E96125